MVGCLFSEKLVCGMRRQPCTNKNEKKMLVSIHRKQFSSTEASQGHRMGLEIIGLEI